MQSKAWTSTIFITAEKTTSKRVKVGLTKGTTLDVLSNPIEDSFLSH